MLELAAQPFPCSWGNRETMQRASIRLPFLLLKLIENIWISSAPALILLFPVCWPQKSYSGSEMTSPTGRKDSKSWVSGPVVYCWILPGPVPWFKQIFWRGCIRFLTTFVVIYFCFIYLSTRFYSILTSLFIVPYRPFPLPLPDLFYLPFPWILVHVTNSFLFLSFWHTNVFPSILLSITAHLPMIFSAILLSLRTSHTCMPPWAYFLASFLIHSLPFLTIHHSLTSCVCQSELPGIHLEEVLLSGLDNTSPPLCFTVQLQKIWDP